MALEVLRWGAPQRLLKSGLLQSLRPRLPVLLGSVDEGVRASALALLAALLPHVASADAGRARWHCWPASRRSVPSSRAGALCWAPLRTAPACLCTQDRALHTRDRDGSRASSDTELVSKSFRSQAAAAAGAVLDALLPRISLHSSVGCRSHYFTILRDAWQQHPGWHPKLRPPLLALLGDPDPALRSQVLAHRRLHHHMRGVACCACMQRAADLCCSILWLAAVGA